MSEVSEEQIVSGIDDNLLNEIIRIQNVAGDRLVWLRLLEKAVNDIDLVIRNLKSDVAEISRQVAARNEDLTITEEEE